MSVPGLACGGLLIGGGAPQIIVTGSNTVTDTANASTYTFNNASGLNSHTHVFLTVTIRGSASAVTVSSLTVEGVAATFVVGLTTGFQRSEIWKIISATVAPDVVVNLSGTAATIAVGIVGARGVDLTNFATPTTSNADPASLNINTANKGIVIAAGMNGGGSNMTWTGVTERHDQNLETSFNHTWGYDTTVTAESPRTVSGNWATSNNNTAVCASFGPAATTVIPPRILDGYSNVTGAWSMSRAIVGSFGDAARYTTNVGVNQIRDQTGNSRHLAVGSGTSEPSPQASLGPQLRLGARFDGVNDVLSTNPTNASSLVSAATGYIVCCAILRSITTNSGTPTSNEFLFLAAADGGIFFRNSAGTLSAYVFGQDGTDDVVALPLAPVIGQVIVCEYRHEGGTLYGRLTLSGGTPGTWASVASGNPPFGTPMAIASNTAELDLLEIVTMNAVPNDTLKDALVSNMLAHYG